MRGFSSDTGLWGNNWWTGASMLTAVNDYAYLDDSANSFKHVYGHIWDDVLNNAPHHNPGRKRRSALNKRDGDYSGFLNDYYDDEGWWVLALVGSYDNTHNQAHLDAAKEIWADINASFDTHECGGIPWKRTDSGPLSIPNCRSLSVSKHFLLLE